MVKDDQDVIAEFNEYVNMTASELENWLKSEESGQAGWRKDDGDGKSVGQDSGEKIVEILKANPEKDPEKYTEDQIQHMRKVASYCKRHLAQESGSLEEKDPEEAKQTKSYISLKNWGHDPLKAQGRDESSGKNSGKDGSKSSSKDKEEEAEDGGQEEQDENEEEGDEEGDEAGDDEKKTGDKRKKTGQQNGANKKRETRQGTSSTKKDEDEADEEEEEENGEDDGENGEQEDGGSESGGKKPSKNGPAKGETVSWKWGSGNPEGKVLDVKDEEATITTKRGNKVSRKGDPEDPAVILDTGKSKAIKSAHELN
ncbi:hypothetical protein DHEL01_v212336 [Diaporthe helianthi]|uniref:Hypervirulence associated protein TUDOR domain-containing protein n=1 Tax=Diaporthe helianthi TaxID=158607 RepID=A0A2P5HG95_DIAHE|nr:hypothetical protein DHEL01_v212336 [Diaporthe helianthi]